MSMPSTWSRVLVLAASALLAGCASLTINVDVYKHTHQVDRDALGRVAARVLADPMLNLSPGEQDQHINLFLDQASEDLQDQLYPIPAALTGSERQKLVSLRGQLYQLLFDRSAGALGAQIEGVLRQELFDSIARLVAAADTMVAKLGEIPPASDAVLKHQHELLIELAQRVDTAPQRVRDGVYEILSQFPQSIQAVQVAGMSTDQLIRQVGLAVAYSLPSSSASGIASQAEISGRIVGYPIFDPGVAGLLTDDVNWAPFSCNVFKANGGNAQFVVVREGSVVFHKKSLDFDPSSAISAGQAASDLALNVAGAIATGKMITTTRGTGGAPDTNTPQDVVNLASLEASKDTLARRRQFLKELLIRLAELAERAEAPNAQLSDIKADFNRIVQTYQAKAGAAP